MTEIDTIIWDVGGVLIRDVPISSEVQKHLELSDAVFKPLWDELIDQYGSGHISEQTFWYGFEAEGAQPQDIAGNLLGQLLEDKLVVYEKVLNLVDSLKAEDYQQAVLSNTIPNHEAVLRNRGIYENFPPDNVFLSHQTGFRKPDMRAFERVIKQLHLKPEHTLYVDDNEAYLQAAERVGIITVRARDSEENIINTVIANL